MIRLPFRALVVAALALNLGLVACSSPEERVAEYLADAETRLADGDIDRAAINFRNVLRIEPRNADALFGMGRIHETREDLPRAFAAYREAADADPTSIEARNAYAVIALTRNRLEDVREAADEIREIDPAHPDGLALAAALALRDERLDEAERLATEALAEDPRHVNATSALAGVHNARGRTRAAVDVLNERFETHGVTVPLALLKTQLLGSIGDSAGVATALEEAISAAPDDVGLRVALARFHESRGEPERAERVLRQAIERLEAPDAAMAALVRFVAANRGVDAAIAEIDQLRTERGDDDFTLAFLAADLLAQAQRLEAAAARLQGVAEATEVNSADNLDARTGLATLARRRDDTERAREMVAAVLEAEPEHRGANYLQASLHLENAAFDEAVAAARAALGGDPEWAPGLRVLAEGHLGQGERDLAIQTLGRLLRAHPGDVAAAGTMARLLAERGDYDQALSVWDHVIARSEDPTAALANAAEIAIRQENWNRASRDIDRLLESSESEVTGTLLAGSLRVARGDAAGAREWFARAREMNPASGAPLMGLVRAHLAENDVEGALAVVREETAQRPDNPLAHLLTAQLERRRDETQAAAAAYRRAIELQPDWATPYRELATLHEAAGNPRAAIQVLEAGSRAGAAGDDLLLRKAFVHQRSDDVEGAIATYARMLDAGVETDVVVNNYGALVADFAPQDTARLERAVALAERFNTSNEAYFVDTLGWLQYRLGNTAEAVALLRRAAAMRPDDAQIRYHLAAAFDAAGEPDLARREVERALVDGADYPGIEAARALQDTLAAEEQAEVVTE
jgi:tetratricopeptide (TPR) repeat protein